METTLFILENPFKDTAISEQDFLCSQCVLMEGVLSLFSTELQGLNVERLTFPRPRKRVLEYVGEDNQSLPTLVLGEGVLLGQETGSYNGNRFIKGQAEILSGLSSIYNIPHVHP